MSRSMPRVWLLYGEVSFDYVLRSRRLIPGAQVISVDFSKDGDWIRSSCEGGQLYIWDSNKGKHQVQLGG